MKYIAVMDPTHKTRWFVARETIGGAFAIIATTRETQAREIAEAMNEYAKQLAKKPVPELSEVVSERTRNGRSWAQRTNQRGAA
jgi:hypothetical protein